MVAVVLYLSQPTTASGTARMARLTSALIDPLLEVVPSAITGGAIAAVLARLK